jgi:hypothetical protein
MFQLFDLVGKIVDLRRSLRRLRELREKRRATGAAAGPGAEASVTSDNAERPEHLNG